MTALILRWITIGTFALFAQASGGGVDFRSEISPLLQKRSDLRRALNGITFEATGSGQRLSGQVAPALAGKRVGPYLFRAYDRQDGAEVEVRFATYLKFYDARGNLLATILNGQWVGNEDLSDAKTVKEEITAIAVTPIP